MTDASPKPRTATTTAGLRGTKWNPERLPSGVRMTAHALTTADKAPVTGYLFERGGEKTVVCLMHPREMNVTQYLVPDLLTSGVAVWIQGPRTPGNDIRLEHEKALLDLATGQVFLRSRGFERTVLQGTSGGGPLATFYGEQAALRPDQRIRLSPGGRPTGLDTAQMPPPDGLILVSAHLGQGQLLQSCIDPAVIDEHNPLQTDATLSAFSEANGFRPAPESARYDAAFLSRYRAAQAERVRRIDSMALAQLARKAEARKRAKATGDRDAAILAAWSPIFEVWRTDADPRCFDLSLDPSERAYGTLWGADQTASNYGSVGFARVCTPESWLSNWSANHSNAGMERCAAALTQPVLMIEYTGDNSVFPSEADRIFASIGASAKSRHRIHGNHHGQRVDPEKPDGQVIAGQTIAAWLEDFGFA